MKMLQYSLSS